MPSIILNNCTAVFGREMSCFKGLILFLICLSFS